MRRNHRECWYAIAQRAVAHWCDHGGVDCERRTLDLGGLSQTVGAVTFGGGTIVNGTIAGTSYNSTGGTASVVLGGKR